MSYAAAFTEGDNIGSLRAVSMAMAVWFKTFVPAISFYNTYDWEQMDFLPESAQLKEDSKDTVNGTEYSYTVTFMFNRQSQALNYTFMKYLGQNAVLLVTDMNGFTRVIGTPQHPVTVVHDADTGEQYRSLNFYKISAKWVSAVPALITSP